MDERTLAMNGTDRITLTGLRATAHHGVFEHERRDGQLFVIDVTVHVDLSRAGTADDLGETVHYGELAEQVVSAVERDPVDLIETVADRVARVVLAHGAALATTVTVHKPGAPITVPFDDVSVTITRSRPTAVVLALGSNLGDREATIRAGVLDLARLPGVELTGASGLIETPALTPEGVDEDAPAYLNAVVTARTTLDPHALLHALHGIEAAHGRVRAERWGDRTLDIDIVDFGGLGLVSEELTLPHPRANERTFVLAPWLQLSPDATLPGLGSVASLLAATGETPRDYPAEPLL